MRSVLQRVNRATVRVDGDIIGRIDKGIMALIGFGQDDIETVCDTFAEKVYNMRIFPDERGRFHHSLAETRGGLLLVPQFTLFADTRKGRRPDFYGALEPEKAEPMFLKLIERCKAAGFENVAAGTFGAYMQVELENDGPVTISLELPPKDQ